MDAYNKAIKYRKHLKERGETDELLNILINQYYYGIEAKRELERYMENIEA